MRSSVACFAFEMPTLDPRFAGFTNTGKPSRSTIVLQDAALVALPVALQHDLVVADRQALRGEHELHRRLVHADGRRQHAGADVRDVRELEQALHRAVFAVRARAAPGTRRRARGPRRRAAEAVAIDGDERVAAGMRDQVRFERGCFGGSCASRLNHVGGRDERRRPLGQRPAAVLLDADRRPLRSGRDRGSRTPPPPRRATLRARRTGRRR